MLRAERSSRPHRCPILAAAGRYSPSSRLVSRGGVSFGIGSSNKTVCEWTVLSWMNYASGRSWTRTSFAMKARL